MWSGSAYTKLGRRGMTSWKPAALCQERANERKLLTPPISATAARRFVTDELFSGQLSNSIFPASTTDIASPSSFSKEVLTGRGYIMTVINEGMLIAQVSSRAAFPGRCAVPLSPPDDGSRSLLGHLCRCPGLCNSVFRPKTSYLGDVLVRGPRAESREFWEVGGPKPQRKRCQLEASSGWCGWMVAELGREPGTRTQFAMEDDHSAVCEGTAAHLFVRK